jgi:hypothetical protein
MIVNSRIVDNQKVIKMIFARKAERAKCKFE